jgi:hypothetical protein
MEANRTGDCTADPAIEGLARVLYEDMERLDPGGDDELQSWDALPMHNRVFYCECIYSLLGRRTLLLSALAHYDQVLRGREATK